MLTRAPALAGLLGGLLLVARAGLDAGDVVAADSTTGAALLVAGLGLVALAGLVAGLGLVPRAATWLQGIVGVGCSLLVVSLLLVVRGDGESAVVDGVLGGVVALVGLVLLARGRERRTPEDEAPAAEAEPEAAPEPEVPAVVVRGSHAAASRRGRRRAR